MERHGPRHGEQVLWTEDCPYEKMRAKHSTGHHDGEQRYGREERQHRCMCEENRPAFQVLLVDGRSVRLPLRHQIVELHLYPLLSA